MDILPADICCKVGEYFGCCRCVRMKENEQHFFKGFTGENNDINKPSNQLTSFTMFKQPLLTTPTIQTYNDRSGKKFKKEIDRISDRQSVKDKYVFNKMDLQAIKSCCKNDSDIIKMITWACVSKKRVNEIFSPLLF